MQLCLNVLPHILTTFMKDAIAQRCTGFIIMGSKEKGGVRAMENTNLQLSSTRVLTAPSMWPEIPYGQLFSKNL